MSGFKPSSSPFEYILQSYYPNFLIQTTHIQPCSLLEMRLFVPGIHLGDRSYRAWDTNHGSSVTSKAELTQVGLCPLSNKALTWR